MIGNFTLHQIEKNIRIVNLNLSDASCCKLLPTKPGWYFIVTNTPPELFKELGTPSGINHYNLSEKALASSSLESHSLCIMPSRKNALYCVYSGETISLRARAREHIAGHPKTYCLALSNYSALRKYIWKFHYSICPYVQNPNETKLLRIFGEQIWRSKNGWPILCGK